MSDTDQIILDRTQLNRLLDAIATQAPGERSTFDLGDRAFWAGFEAALAAMRAVADRMPEVPDQADEIEKLRGDVREWERQFAALGGAAGRGEQLDAVPSPAEAAARLRALADLLYGEDAYFGVTRDVRSLRRLADSVGFPDDPTSQDICRVLAGMPAAAPSPVREPAPAEEGTA